LVQLALAGQDMQLFQQFDGLARLDFGMVAHDGRVASDVPATKCCPLNSGMVTERCSTVPPALGRLS
jgi:hypothetical protein